MTRKEAKSFEWFQRDREQIEKHIDKIYDTFEKMIDKSMQESKYTKSADLVRASIRKLKDSL